MFSYNRFLYVHDSCVLSICRFTCNVVVVVEHVELSGSNRPNRSVGDGI